jgi:WD40 repeat protein
MPAVAPDDTTIAVGASSGLLVLMDMKTGVLQSKLSCHTSAIQGVAWNGQALDSDVVAASCDRMGSLVFWKAALQDAGEM